MRRISIIIALISSFVINAQELNCDVIVNAQLTGNENLQVFKTLERQVKEFVNSTKWTNKTFKPQEKINCSMVITIQENSSDAFEATLQIQSSRPVFNSSYSTPIYNFNDQDFNFTYLQFQNFVYNPNQFESNLVSVLAFHVYIILGLDADSFAQNGGSDYFRQAQIIMNYSQQSNLKGWKLEDGRQSRFALITDILSPTYKEFRDVMYNYHYKGLDQMAESTSKAKTSIASSLNSLNPLNQRRPNSFLMRIFFDAKSEEILDVFSGGPSVKITDLLTTLNRIAPLHASKWKEISY
ncbi:DUF4835 family protein [Winogradskyella sp. 3972H.M.0a.05]|uniref:type IX secretion system protein PorD n=1 Tax=Winogradskyella sp. 3972H.M.0a.05 TaxID=2950277 RepID=UPI0033991C76